MRTIVALVIALALSQAALARGGGNASGGKNDEPSGGWKTEGPCSNVRDHRNGGSQGGVTVTKGTPKMTSTAVPARTRPYLRQPAQSARPSPAVTRTTPRAGARTT